MEQKQSFIHKFSGGNVMQMLAIVVVVALVLGLGTGYVLSASKNGSGTTASPIQTLTNQPPKNADQDTKTFSDFAEGTITKKPVPKSGEVDPYSEGTAVLTRDGAKPVALTSSVVDLSLYENKKVKVYGSTQKALQEGWLMDVGRVEVEN
jgi:hypothetical protein